ncbi:MAG: hypothetical protein KGH58_00430 [Candidatus Micrarchaeota archaeon]|nr:hypothetical protein [Candidatus Micrarchaeota archaeon]
MAAKEKTIKKSVDRFEKLSQLGFETIQDVAQNFGVLFNDANMAGKIYEKTYREEISKGKSEAEAKEVANKAKESAELVRDYFVHINGELHTRPDDKNMNERRQGIFDQVFDEEKAKEASRKEAAMREQQEFLAKLGEKIAEGYSDKLNEQYDSLSEGISQKKLNELMAAVKEASDNYILDLAKALEREEMLNRDRLASRKPEELNTIEEIKKQIESSKELSKKIKQLMQEWGELLKKAEQESQSKAKGLKATPEVIDNSRSLLDNIREGVEKLIASASEAGITGNRPTMASMINTIVEARDAQLWSEFHGTGSLEDMRKKAIEYLNKTNEMIRYDPEVMPFLKLIDQLSYIGTIKGGVEGASRVAGTFAEKWTAAKRKAGQSLIYGDTKVKLLERAIQREYGPSANMSPSKHFIRALESTFGKDSFEITSDIINMVMKSIPENKRNRKGILSHADMVLNGMARIRGEAKVASTVTTILNTGLLGSTGNRAGDNRKEGIVKVMLHPNTVTYSMLEDMSDYLAKMTWAQEYFSKHNQALNQLTDNIERLKINYEAEAAHPEKLMAKYMSLFKLVNLTWVEMRVTSMETRLVLFTHIQNARTILDAEAVGRMLMEQYLRSTKKAFNLSEKEAKFLEKFKERNRSPTEYISEDELWYDILAKIEKKLQEQEAEKAAKAEGTPLMLNPYASAGTSIPGAQA